MCAWPNSGGQDHKKRRNIYCANVFGARLNSRMMCMGNCSWLTPKMLRCVVRIWPYFHWMHTRSICRFLLFTQLAARCVFMCGQLLSAINICYRESMRQSYTHYIYWTPSSLSAGAIWSPSIYIYIKIYTRMSSQCIKHILACALESYKLYYCTHAK